MGIIDKFNDPNATKALQDELKSKVGIQSEDKTKSTEESSAKGEQGKKQGGNYQKEYTKPKKAEAKTPDGKKVIDLPNRQNTKKQNIQQQKRKESNLREKKEPEITGGQDEELASFLEAFKQSYKQSEKDNRMLRIQRKNYKELVKLKVDNIAISEFVNFAIAFALKSKRFETIIKQLK